MSSQKKSLPKVDPFAERETKKYQQPIPSREFIMMQLATVGKPMNFKAIAELLGLANEVDLASLERRLAAMERDGQLIRNRRKGYGLAKKMDLISGRVIAHSGGYGFLVPDEGGTDLFLSEHEMRCLLHGDRVLVSTISVDRRGRRSGMVVEILEHNTHEVVGRFIRDKSIAFVEPDNRRIHQDIVVPPDQWGGAKHGQIVVVKLIHQPTRHHPPVGQVIEIIGENFAPGMEIDISIRAHELPCTWPEVVLNEIRHLREEVPETALAGRKDLRFLPFVTIDGEDAKDFDDAVYCEPRGKGWLLRVAIADVSAYVKLGTALDEEAKKRGNSVYFPSRVIPMLPEILSNGLCSLKPQVDRLSVVCELTIDTYGRIRRTHFFEAVICSAARLTYTEVAAVLDNHEHPFRYPQLLPALRHLHQLYLLLKKRREKRGAIDFDTTETQIIFNQQRKIDKIIPVIRNEAHRLIEEMMLAANVATAEWLHAQEMPLLYRIHEGPQPEKLADLKSFLNTLGLRLGGNEDPQAHHYAKLIEKAHDRPDIRLIQTVLLRSLKIALYSPENQGHFGLSYSAYTHFTSPIRRYPDLLIHRAIKHCLQKQPVEKFPYSVNELQLLGEHCSMTERRADDATRDAISWLKCEYMQDKIGQEYDGLITGVTPFGLFVELEGVFIEGLVHVTSLQEDYYHFDPVGHRLQGELSGKIYRLSDPLRIKVVRVNLEEKKIDFELVQPGKKRSRKPGKGKK
ncbi:MAG: ribonuclease R [Beggiatoa sp. IS2]|nr:MAG: ribonuclease R [Beggiatoa sp. IS2]